MHATPEESIHTSIKERIEPVLDLEAAIKQQMTQGLLRHKELTLKPLLPFEGGTTHENQMGILFTESDYLALVDSTGRCVREDKRGAIDAALPPILARLGLGHSIWLENATQFERLYQARFAKRRKARPSAA